MKVFCCAAVREANSEGDCGRRAFGGGLSICMKRTSLSGVYWRRPNGMATWFDFGLRSGRTCPRGVLSRPPSGLQSAKARRRPRAIIRFFAISTAIWLTFLGWRVGVPSSDSRLENILHRSTAFAGNTAKAGFDLARTIASCWRSTRRKSRTIPSRRGSCPRFFALPRWSSASTFLHLTQFICAMFRRHLPTMPSAAGGPDVAVSLLWC